MKISLLVVDLSSNPIARAFPIAKALKRHFETEIIGMCFGDSVLPAYESEFNYKIIPGQKFPRALQAIRECYKLISGDLIYAFKPHLTTFGIGLLSKLRDRKPVILDIDDFETAPFYKQPFVHNKLRFRKQFLLQELLLKEWSNPLGLRYQYVMQKLIHLADRTTVASEFLLQRFGGTKLPHGVDANLFDPTWYNREESRQRLGFKLDDIVVTFTGTPREHKGLDDLAQAVSALSKEYRLVILIVGGYKGDKHVEHLKANYSNILHIESQPHALIPYYLAAADIVALPQKDNLISRAQVPVKLFEAMAMAKPIVASQVSDLPEILNGCGLLFEAGNVEELVQQLRRLCQDRELGLHLGLKARERVLANYSIDSIDAVLTQRVLAPWISSHSEKV